MFIIFSGHGTTGKTFNDNIVINKLNHFITNISIYTFEEKKKYILDVLKN